MGVGRQERIVANPQLPTPISQAPDLVTLTIDGRQVRVPKGILLVDAATQAGIEIPVFCYHPKLKSVGACRMCLVEIEKMPRLQTACTSPVVDGMVVYTNTPNVVGAQTGVLELLLANHPLDCPICDKGGECPLQDNTFKYGTGTSRYTERKRLLAKALPLSDRIVLDRERCILCYRCTRFQAEIPGDEVLAVLDRGGHSEIGVLPGETFDSPFSGNTIELCPVGALTSRQYRFKARPWDLERTPTVCAGCAVGCNVEVHTRDGRVQRIVSRENREIDDGWLCDYGRFDTMPPVLEGRAVQPLVRGKPAAWDEAYAHAATVLRSGPAGMLASPGLTNEAIWLFADALRAALPEAPAAFWPSGGTGWLLRGAIRNLLACRTIVLVGLDPWNELPILALWLRKAVLGGSTLLVIGPQNGLYRDTAHWLRIPAGHELGIVKQIVRLASPAWSGAKGPGSRAAKRAETVTGRAAWAGREPDRRAIAAAAQALGRTPAALLVHPRLAGDQQARGLLERLATAMGADGETGMLGSPPLAANGRGAMDLAADIAMPPAGGDVVGRATAGDLLALLLLGREEWPPAGGARRILVTTGPIDDAEAAEVVLPIAHPYEQAGSLTNLEGRVQFLEAAARPPQRVPPDWLAVADLAAALGGSPPRELAAIRASLAEAHPAYRFPESGGRRRGKLDLPVASADR